MLQPAEVVSVIHFYFLTWLGSNSVSSQYSSSILKGSVDYVEHLSWFPSLPLLNHLNQDPCSWNMCHLPQHNERPKTTSLYTYFSYRNIRVWFILYKNWRLKLALLLPKDAACSLLWLNYSGWSWKPTRPPLPRTGGKAHCQPHSSRYTPSQQSAEVVKWDEDDPVLLFTFSIACKFI